MNDCDLSAWKLPLSKDLMLKHARFMTQIYAYLYPEFGRVLTAGERREQYADYYARTIMRLTA